MILLMIALQAADGALTWYAISRGLASEANGFLARLMDRFGVVPTLVATKAIAAALGIYVAVTAPLAAVLFAAGYCVVIALNIRTIRKALK